MGMGLRTNVYRIGGDPLTQLIVFFLLNFVFFIRNVDSDKINGKCVVGDPMAQFKLIK